MTKPPKPPSGTGIALDYKREKFVIVTGPLKIYRAHTLGAVLQTYDGTGTRVSITRVLTLGMLGGIGFRKGTGEVTIIITGRDGSMATVKVKPKKAQEVLTWAFEFTAWNEAEHRALGLPYPPVIGGTPTPE